ncbi:hypothetical protein V500_02457 [Pseudogymnoascus sp. VKM F-4518 (FW-2643)]|nr:hypothetical protein V500_02457 [Pseudogymnoascus sp. VKM F-4518 (FW-2643)]
MRNARIAKEAMNQSVILPIVLLKDSTTSARNTKARRGNTCRINERMPIQKNSNEQRQRKHQKGNAQILYNVLLLIVAIWYRDNDGERDAAAENRHLYHRWEQFVQPSDRRRARHDRNMNNVRLRSYIL